MNVFSARFGWLLATNLFASTQLFATTALGWQQNVGLDGQKVNQIGAEPSLESCCQ
jgi:hypothetical protein